MKIILDKEMSDYISRFFNNEIKKIYLDTNSENIKSEFAYFIKALLERRTFTAATTPYTYNEKSKSLSFYKYDPILDSSWEVYK